MRKLGIQCALAVFAAAATARADTITMTNTNAGNASDLTAVNLVYKSGSTTIDLNGELAGAIKWTVDGSSSSLKLPGNGSSVVTYCIEIGQNVYIGQGPYTWNLATLVGAPYPNGSSGGASLSPPNPVNGMTQIQADWLNALVAAESPGNFDPSDLTDAAAFQLAIWEVVYETPALDDTTDPYSLLGGTFSATGPAAAVTQADIDLGDAFSLLNGPFGSKYSFPGSGLVALTSDSTDTFPNSANIQDQMLAIPAGTSPPSAPLPSIAGLGMAMLGALALGRWRFGRATTGTKD